MFGRTVWSSSLGTEVPCSRTPQPERHEISNPAFGSCSVSPADNECVLNTTVQAYTS